jgi:hypothetical protein
MKSKKWAPAFVLRPLKSRALSVGDSVRHRDMIMALLSIFFFFFSCLPSRISHTCINQAGPSREARERVILIESLARQEGEKKKWETENASVATCQVFGRAGGRRVFSFCGAIPRLTKSVCSSMCGSARSSNRTKYGCSNSITLYCFQVRMVRVKWYIHHILCYKYIVLGTRLSSPR